MPQRKKVGMQTLQALWEQTMQELGLFEDIVDSFDSVGEV